MLANNLEGREVVFGTMFTSLSFLSAANKSEEGTTR